MTNINKNIMFKKLIHTSGINYMNTDSVSIDNNQLLVLNDVPENKPGLGLITKEIYEKILWESYNQEETFDSIMEGLEDFLFITSLSLSEILSDNKEVKNVIASTHLTGIGMEILLNTLKNNLELYNYTYDIHIITISWLKTISLDEKIDIKEINLVNDYNSKIIIRDMSYTSFFKNINVISESISEIENKNKNYLGINPIIIFRGLTWNNIVHLFKINNININGGSISRRHKLSICEYRLSLFLRLLGFFDKQNFYYSYVEKYITSARYDRNSEITMAVHPYVSQYLSINNCLNLKLQENEIETNISKIEKEIEFIRSEEISTMRYIGFNDDSISRNKQQIFLLKQKFEDGIREKQKGSLKGRIKKYEYENKDLISENTLNSSKLLSLKNKLEEKLKRLKKLNSDLNDIKIEIDKYKSNIKVYKKNTVINSSIGNRREYHSLSRVRYYSSSNGYSINKLNFNFNSPVYIELQRILNNGPLDENTQIKIEEFLYNQGVILLENRMNQNSDINYDKLNYFVIESLKKSYGELSILLDNYRSNINNINNINNKNSIQDRIEYLLLNKLSNDLIINKLLGMLLRIISNHNLLNKNTNCTELAYELGDSLLYTFYSQEYKKSLVNDTKEIGLKNFIDKNYSELEESITNTVLSIIGFKLLNFLEEVNLIHSELYIKNKDEKIHIYVSNDEILESIGKSFGLLNMSYKIPMIVPPKSYERVNGQDILGGYLLNDREYINPIIIKNTELKEQSSIKDDNIIFDTVNNLSSVGYKINIPVLEFILEKGLEYELFIDPNFQHPLEIKKNNKEKLTLYEKKILDSFLSRKKLELNILGLATIFKNVPQFFIPVRIDNRGRIYCMVDYLNYQGIELAKSLLLFSKGEKIQKCDKQSIDYLKIFGANCFGNGIDKKSYNDRINWVKENEENILNFRNGCLIKKADSKLLFIAFCFEYMNFYNCLFSNETTYTSYFPIQLDATCNGYQHLSLLMGDEPLAGKLNLISGDVDSIPEDFYTFVGLKLNDYLKLKLSEELNKKEKYEYENKDLVTDEYNNIEKNIQSCTRLIKLNKKRSLVKTPIMVKPYNASLFRMIEYTKENFNKVTKTLNNENNLFDDIRESLKTKDNIYYIDKNDSNVILTNYDFHIFVSTMEKVVYTEFPKLKEFNLYLNSIATICSMLNITITWTLPNGLNVNQYYVDSEAIRLKPFKYRKNTFNIKIKKKNVINKSKQVRSLMPNLIHSLDAASLCLIINMFYQEMHDNSKVFNFFGIHDCFAVTSNNVSNLIKIIKLVYIKIYSDDSYLRRFDRGIIDSIKLQFGNDSFNEETKIIKVNGHILEYPDVDKIILGQIKACKINKALNIIT